MMISRPATSARPSLGHTGCGRKEQSNLQPFASSSSSRYLVEAPPAASEMYLQKGLVLCQQVPQLQLVEGKELGSSYKPGKFDVICAKGAAAKQHTGNRRFRIIIEMNLNRYRKAGKSRAGKSRVVSDVIDSIRASSPKGGFIRMHRGEWIQVSEHHAREKVGQSFRDSLHTEYKSSSKAKRLKRKVVAKKQDNTSRSSPAPTAKLPPESVAVALREQKRRQRVMQWHAGGSQHPYHAALRGAM